MLMTIDNCVDCTSMGLHCRGASCPNRSMKVHCCDGCESSEETLYYFDGGEYCIYCITEMLEMVRDD